jgi:hypothetical protein
MGFAAKLGEHDIPAGSCGWLTPQHKQTKPPELSASPGVLNPEEQVDTDSQLAHQVATALNLLKDSTVNLNRATNNNLSKVNTAPPLVPLRDITVDPVNPVNLALQVKGSTALNLSLDHHTALPLVHLLDPDNLLREPTDNSPRVSTDNNPDMDKGSTDNSLDRDSMVSSLDKDNTVSSQDKDRGNTANNLLKVNTVNNQDKDSTVNNPLKDSMANSPLLRVEEVSMLGTSPPFYSNVFKM